MTDTVSGPFWSLSLNFVPGASRQEWEINHSKPGDFHELLVTNHKGEGSTAQIARDVCARRRRQHREVAGLSKVGPAESAFYARQ